MEEEGVRNFKELRAKFQNCDALPLLGPIKLPASVSQKGDFGCTRPPQILAHGKPLPSNHNWPPSHGSIGESQTPKTQQMKLTQRSKIQKSPSFPGLLENPAVCSPRNSQEASLLLDVNRSNTEMTSEEKGTVANSFQDKLRKWEKVSSQKSVTFSALLLTNGGGKAFHPEEEKSTKFLPHRPREKIQTKWALTLPSKKELAQRKALATCEQPPSPCSQAGEKNQEKPSVEGNSAGGPCQPVYECELAIPAPANPPDTQHRQLPRTKPLPPVGSLGPAPPKPLKPPAVDLQAFQRQPAALSKAQYKADMKESLCPLESAEFEEPHNYEATISYLRHLGNSINLCTAEEIADSTYDVGIEELQKPWKSFLHQELRPKREDEDKHMKEKDPCGLEHQNSEQDPHSKHPFKVDVYEVTPEDIQMTTSHGDRWSTVARQQETMTDEIEAKACPEDMDLVRPSQGQGVESLELTTHTQDLVAFKSCSGLQATYDDVDCPVTDISKSDFSSSFTSDSVPEESSEEMYEDVYKTKSNSSPIDLDGKEALKRLQQFFKKEKDRFKMKATKSKENLRAFSVSLPDLQLRSQEVIIYDDVTTSERKSNHEDKMKTWRPNFLIPRRKKEKNRVEGSESFFPRNFFRIKKQNSLEKNRVREEKLFRQRFQYDKEITVINRAVVCSSNSRNGIFDLPITPGEELEVIDTTDQNLVICRNSKGKYGYVLIEHLDFNAVTER
ncbi:activation-dependent, raft-recruited ADAP-like phosphoprotein [Heterocephalus glaber]|uniref:FYN-binding protein 2 n=1 Tax=Heterocephalus glaber TaxID=10181 RepID=A0AAX6S887_HETGA|nr:activation-dependent, raft-recruited ADAP-like phosphoprotein [Heterocephalus glaber]